MRALFRKSKWIHKYIGLLIIIFAMWMSISGIFLNHPELIADITVPPWLIPQQYKMESWNRSSLITAVFRADQPDTAYVAGKQGVWRTSDGGRSFEKLTTGYPGSVYYGKAYTLYLDEDHERLYAGTEGGLYACNLNDEIWREIELPGNTHPVKRIMNTGASIVVVTNSGAFLSPVFEGDPRFEPCEIKRETNSDRVTLVELFFGLHSGKAWGLAGRLLFDLAGLVIIFLSLSAFYIWFYPRRQKKNARKRVKNGNRHRRKIFVFFAEYHNLLGIWFALLLVVLGFTGIFMRPPLLAVIAQGDVPSWLYPATEKHGPWHEKIHNAVYDERSGAIILATTEGFWSGPTDFSESFSPLQLDVPVFVMGATVLEIRGENYIVGSFNGLFQKNLVDGRIIDMLNGTEPKRVSNVRPAEKMVTGYFETADGDAFITAHEQGLVPVSNQAGGNSPFIMPAQLETQPEMSLWNFMFELHNGRIFKDIIGDWYILVVPLGSILFFLVIVSGIYDWLYITLFNRRRNGTSK